jgi:Xaa-Pro dipeptidase
MFRNLVSLNGGIHIKTRVKKAFKAVKGVDAILLQNSNHLDASFFYFTGIHEGLFEFASVVMRPPDKIELITYELEKEAALGGDYKLTVHKNRDGLPNVLKSLKGCKKIAINAAELKLASFRRLESALPKVEWVDISKKLDEIRLVKDKNELDLMRKACQISSRVADYIPNIIHEGMTEKELSAEITKELLKRGCSKLAFDTIVCFGPNAAIPHHFPDDSKLKKNQFIICDFGGAVGKYCSDITRTYVYGKPSDKMLKIHDCVKKAQDAAIRTMRAGVNGRDVHKKVEAVLAKYGFKGKMPHSTGHALGIDVHDCSARLHSEIDQPLKEGMVFTVEPGVYIRGFGGVRIEDDVVVRKKGVEFLTDADRGLWCRC